MATEPAYETVKSFAEDYINTLLYIKDIDSFAIYHPVKQYYEILDQKKMSHKMWKYVYEKTNKCYSMPNIQSSYLSYLSFESLMKIPSVFCPELWYKNRYNYISLQDKILNLDTFDWEEKDPTKFSFHYLPFSYAKVQEAECPQWHKFLDEVLVFEDDLTKTDPELKKLVQQMFGYCLANTIKAQKAFFMYGESRAGKGVITSILSTMMGGTKFITNNKLGTLKPDSFSLSNLVGKKANIAGEEESSVISADTFKELVAGDVLTANKKFKDAFSFAPQIKLIMSSNKFLRFKYVDTAIEERLIVIRFFRHFKEHERDYDLAKKLHLEIPGILSWALEGLTDLKNNDWKFKLPESSIKAMGLIKEEVSNVLKFFNENYEPSDEGFVPSEDLYTTYRNWCDKNGYRGVMTNSNFFKELNNSIEDFEKCKVRKLMEDGTRPYGYNYKLKEGGWVDNNKNVFN